MHGMGCGHGASVAAAVMQESFGLEKRRAESTGLKKRPVGWAKNSTWLL